MSIVTCTVCGTKNRVDDLRLTKGEAKCGKCRAKLEADSQHRSTQFVHPIVITDATFDSLVVQASSGSPVILDCWAPWCGPCRMIAPIMDQLAAESRGRYVVGKLNVDENPRVASQFRIASIPTMLIFKGGELVDRLVGLQGKDAIASRLNTLINAA